MVHAKNDETVSTFVKVMPKKPWPLFFSGHGVYGIAHDGHSSVERLQCTVSERPWLEQISWVCHPQLVQISTDSWFSR